MKEKRLGGRLPLRDGTMNIFLPYENDIIKSVRSLDDARLIKQILEMKTIYDAVAKWRNGEEDDSYLRHPIIQHYKDYPDFLILYGFSCCSEYHFRFGKVHQYEDFFFGKWRYTLGDIDFVPFYVSGKAGTPECIRTTENVSRLYQQRLCDKWSNDKYPPKWTKRGKPNFYEHT